MTSPYKSLRTVYDNNVSSFSTDPDGSMVRLVLSLRAVGTLPRNETDATGTRSLLEL